MPAAGGTPKALAASFDAQPSVAGWSADGKHIYFSEPRGTGTRVYSINLGANTITEIDKGTEVLTGIDLNAGGTMFGFTSQTSERPPEAYVSRVDNFAPVR